MWPGSSGGSNGVSTGAVSHGPIPAEAMVHVVVLLPEPEQRLAQFLQSLQERWGDLRAEEWQVLEQPRACSWCDFQDGEWRFRLVFDPEGVPPSLRPTVAAGKHTHESLEALEEHRACCLLFLLSAPPVTPWERFLGMLRLAWAWVDAGATVLAFPEAELMVPRRILLGVEPGQLAPEQAYLFLSNGLADSSEKGGERKLWLRTWGLGQFALPDLAAELPSIPGQEQHLEGELESLRLLFETLPPAMIREHGILPVGGTVQLGSRTWTAVGESSVEYPFLRSRCGVQLFV